MPEPEGTAKYLGEIAPGVHHFSMLDNRINAQSDSYVIENASSVVFVDPLPMQDSDLERLGKPGAIVLTASCHERASHRYSQKYQIPIWAPEGAVDFEDEPDRYYTAETALPAGLQPVHSPGPTEAHYSLYLPEGVGLIFCADLLTNPGEGILHFVPSEYQDAPLQTRDSVRNLLKLRFEILCPNHGAPVLKDARQKITEALGRDAGS
ncbi:MAG: MBL fold metallo-hydrolase [Armatimonadetes bacterium]|nr:MBL fold metallo-hydrolase [Armatimonadota bacterium]